MRIEREALAGTLESNDALVRVAPGEELLIDVQSSVLAQYGARIREVVAETLASLGVTAGLVWVEDKGALDFTLRARVQGAVLRSNDEPVDWSAL